MASNKHRGWTEAEIDEIVRLYTIEGWGLVTIGRQYGVADPTIRRVLKRRGITPRKASKTLTQVDKDDIVRSYRDDKVSIQSLAKRYEVSRQAARGVINLAGLSIERGWTNRIAFTAEQEADIVARYQREEAARDIGIAYGCCFAPINRILAKHGIPIRPCGSSKRAASMREGFTCLPKTIYAGRRMRAIKNGCEWHITIADVNAQYQKQDGRCFYTGQELKTTGCQQDYTLHVTNHPRALSIDRRDSARDYTPDNIVLCCRWVNFAKNQWDETTFRGLMAEAAENLIGDSFAERRARSEESVTA